MSQTPHTTAHKDGTVTYWSVYEQCWHHRAEVVPDRELAAMTQSERHRIARSAVDVIDDPSTIDTEEPS